MEHMIADFDRMAADFDREILIEQQRSGIHDPAHFAYPIYAKAAMLRRDNLKRSADDLRARIAKAKETLLGVGVAACRERARSSRLTRAGLGRSEVTTRPVLKGKDLPAATCLVTS
jgi:hypothetical protein